MDEIGKEKTNDTGEEKDLSEEEIRDAMGKKGKLRELTES